MKKLNSKGFGAVEVLLIVILVGIIGAVGWYVMKSKNNSNSSYNNAGNAQSNTVTTPKKTTSTTTTTNGVKYLVIKEWNIKLPLTADIADAYYVKNSSSDSAMNLGVKSLDSISACKADTLGVPFDELGKWMKGETNPVTGEDPHKEFPNGSDINGTYYATIASGAPCTEDSVQKAKLEKVIAAFDEAAKNIVAN